MSIPIAKKCYAPGWSYGEICVGCNCCGRINKDKKSVIKARLKYARWELRQNNEFNQWCENKSIRELQEKNVASNKKYWKSKIKKLLEAPNG